MLSSASCRGLGLRVGCGLVFCVAFGCSTFSFGRSAGAVVSFRSFFGSRLVLVEPVEIWPKAVGQSAL